jgi:hypothetical protein
MSLRQQRISELVDQGYTLNEATGRSFAERAGFGPHTCASYLAAAGLTPDAPL